MEAVEVEDFAGGGDHQRVRAFDAGIAGGEVEPTALECFDPVPDWTVVQVARRIAVFADEGYYGIAFFIEDFAALFEQGGDVVEAIKSRGRI